jgi:hypothetical protein
MDNLDLVDQSENFMICCDDISEMSTDTWKTGLELHEDNQTTLSSCTSKFDNQYQVLAIVDDNSKEFDDNKNPVLNPTNITRGANHMAEGDTADSLANRAKIQLSAEEWNTIKAAVEHGIPIPTDASKNVLLGYHYALRKKSRQLAEERSEIQKSKYSASAAFHAACSNASHMDNRRHRRHGSRVKNLKHSDRRNLSRNLDSSFLSVDEQGNIITKTPKAVLVVAQTCLYTTRPNPGDPREHMHRAALQGLRLVGNKLIAKDKEAYRNKGTHNPRSPRRHNSPRHRTNSR